MRYYTLTRTSERQLWLMLLVITLAVNALLLLVLHSPWASPGPLVLDRLSSQDLQVLMDQLHQQDITGRGSRHHSPQLEDTGREKSAPRGAKKGPPGLNRSKGKVLARNIPRLEEKMEHEEFQHDAGQRAPEHGGVKGGPVQNGHVKMGPDDFINMGPGQNAFMKMAPEEDEFMNVDPEQGDSRKMGPDDFINMRPEHDDVKMGPDDFINMRPEHDDVKMGHEQDDLEKMAPDPDDRQGEVPSDLLPRPVAAEDEDILQGSRTMHEKNAQRLEQLTQSLQVFSDEDPQWRDTSYFEPRSTVVTSFQPEILIDSVRCPPRGPYLLVLIPSVDVNVRVRQAIRSTWASPAYGALWPHDARNITSLLKVVFFFGVRTQGKSAILEKESQMFQDIVQVNFEETHQNLSLKTALAVEWSAAFCPGAGHVMKVDEDTFVTLPLLLHLLNHLSDHAPPRFVLGFHHFNERPPVLRKGKWEVSFDLYPYPHFPRYLYRHSYVMSSGAVRELKAVWRYMPLVPSEDAFLTGVLAKVAGITRIHCDWFARDDSHTEDPVTAKEVADGWSVSQAGFRPLQKHYDVWEMVKNAVVA
ncbi:uncharacterized protein LOC143283657 [Babylonia areolata]|uniref:uncharacterized protein LOC143283657 n=1 Tax=Babylonia areolata TaxID=304850 RepID=UPI003FD41E8D